MVSWGDERPGTRQEDHDVSEGRDPVQVIAQALTPFVYTAHHTRLDEIAQEVLAALSAAGGVVVWPDDGMIEDAATAIAGLAVFDQYSDEDAARLSVGVARVALAALKATGGEG